MFHLSLSAIGTTTSLKSGFPSRDTCCQGPTPSYLPVALLNTRDLRRLAVAQTPMVDLGASGFVGMDPSRVS